MFEEILAKAILEYYQTMPEQLISVQYCTFYNKIFKNVFLKNDVMNCIYHINRLRVTKVVSAYSD